MKAFLTLLFIGGTCLSWASDHSGEWVPRYKVVSDVYDSSLEPGTVKVQGQVYQQVYNFEEEKTQKKPVARAKISTLQHTASCLSDGKGNYSFQITDKDSVLYMFKVGLTEVVMSKYDFKSQHVVTIDFMPTEGTMIEITEKPVIYIYAGQSTEVAINVKQVGEMTFTYPAIKEGWKVTAGADGTLTDYEGQTYPYLFWEAKRKAGIRKLGNTLPGSFVNQHEVLQFLEESLSKLGLNAREKTDFITYWAPRMINHQQVFVQFTIDDDVAPQIGELEVTPKPDHLRRVFMTFVDANKMNYFDSMAPMKQELSTFSRDGLTVVEWGGTELTGALQYEN